MTVFTNNLAESSSGNGIHADDLFKINNGLKFEQEASGVTIDTGIDGAPTSGKSIRKDVFPYQ